MNMNNKKIVVVDTDVPYEQDNRLFDKSANKDNRFLWYWSYLYEECRKRGIELVTSDIHFSLAEKPKNAPFISANMWSKDTSRLIKIGLRPAIIFGYENPLYACRFYFNLRKFTRDFDHAFVWSGARKLLATNTQFHDAAYRPQAYPFGRSVKGGFRKRRFLTMINRANRIHPLKRLYVNVMQKLQPLPTLVNQELYLDRLEVIRYFSRNAQFDLYGTGWAQSGGRGEIREAIKKVYRGYVKDKLEILQNYKFSICFENAIFGGLVSEKIIDSLFAGCIPVYFGAPDVADYIPKSCFIDFRDFKNYEELERCLENFGEKEYNKYVQNINHFLASKNYYNFTQEKFAKDTINILSSYF